MMLRGYFLSSLCGGKSVREGFEGDFQRFSFGSITGQVSFAAARTGVTQCSPPPRRLLQASQAHVISVECKFTFSQQSRWAFRNSVIVKISCISEHSSCSAPCADLQAVPLNDPKGLCGRISYLVFYSSRTWRRK